MGLSLRSSPSCSARSCQQVNLLSRHSPYAEVPSLALRRSLPFLAGGQHLGLRPLVRMATRVGVQTPPPQRPANCGEISLPQRVLVALVPLHELGDAVDVGEVANHVTVVEHLDGLDAYKLTELSNPACNYGETYMTAIKSLPYFPDSDESSFGRRLKT